MLVLSISACSGSDKDKEEHNLSASQVCDSTLDSSAAAALQRIGGTKEFTELPGSNDAGNLNKFSLKHAASTIYDDVTQRNQCAVFKAGDKTGHSLIEVDFSAAKYPPNRDDSSAGGKSENTVYPFGVYAKTHDNTSATLYFKCSIENAEHPKGSAKYIQAYLYSTPDQISPKTTGRDLMIVLNSISRSMAKQLGCASQAALPSHIPDA
jgi:hypothetical protein